MFRRFALAVYPLLRKFLSCFLYALTEVKLHGNVVGFILTTFIISFFLQHQLHFRHICDKKKSITYFCSAHTE